VKIFHLPSPEKIKIVKPVLTIGKLDGIHQGHQTLISRIVARASRENGTPAVLTFEPHPKEFFSSNRRFKRINTPEQKKALLEKLGVKIMLIQRFDGEFAAASPEEFVKKVLVEQIGLSTLVFSVNFKFGRDGGGDYQLMTDLAWKYGFNIELVKPKLHNGMPVSSTSAREAIYDGNMKLAAELLGREYSIEGAVVKGKGLGGKSLYPTANILPANELLPPHGVYATWFEAGNRRFKSVTNIGLNPTTGEDKLSVETHVIGLDEDLYGNNVTLHFAEKIRDEIKFSSLDELREQISRDIEKSLSVLESTQRESI
jgi:riboflavin kinase/FMN adenylyltransferase